MASRKAAVAIMVRRMNYKGVETPLGAICQVQIVACTSCQPFGVNPYILFFLEVANNKTMMAVGVV